MLTISTTELRTKTKELIATLKSGQAVTLIHQSKPVAQLEPKIDTKLKHNRKIITDLEAFKKRLDALKPEKLLSDKERERIYREHLEKKYGKSIP